MKSALYYIHDPMCSWCWAFRPVWHIVSKKIPQHIQIRNLLGGLAPDTDQPMSESLQNTIRQTWKRIQTEVPGTEFNYDFWQTSQPRRSTYPACRAVIAARFQGIHYEQSMIFAIQQAYYLNAKNPSDDTVLVELAEGLGLNTRQFQDDLNSDKTCQQLDREITDSKAIGVQGFPSLIWLGYGNYRKISLNYVNAETLLQEIVIQTQ